ncbi:MAG: pyruvate, phosphate dikinase [Acidobacteria bacterium]|nr:pyruvate, phosphate dikinase [Acidobacteriota bacterium]
MSKKFVYFFGGGAAEGDRSKKDLLGGKGAGLAEMTNAGLPVPPGFTISTEACLLYFQDEKNLPQGLQAQMDEALSRLEKLAGQALGSSERPLLLSVRSGAALSMPGMMDTVLNLGLNDVTVQALARWSGDERFAYDCYRRFVQTFGSVVLGVQKSSFEELLDDEKKRWGVRYDSELPAAALKELVDQFQQAVRKQAGLELPQDPQIQLGMARDAVFRSWNTPRAIKYRQMHEIPDTLGTAVNVQMMVFGNLGERSGSGVGFTRNPSTGQRLLYGEFLPNAQGEDVVAGVRTPLQFSELEKKWPDIYRQLSEIAEKLERHYRDVQDFEFTVQQGKLYILQTRTGKRTGVAAVKIAVDMVREGLVSQQEALGRVEPQQLVQFLHPIFDPSDRLEVIATGLPASPGAAVGRVVFTAGDAVQMSKKGEPVILVRNETSAEDIHGMEVARAILTARGGMTSHAAVVARGMGKCCVVGCDALKVDERNKVITVNGLEIREGDFLSVDGTAGRVIKGKAHTIAADPSSDEFADFMRMADAARALGVRANADIPRDAQTARRFGAEGIGLCRTEHMFFAEDRLPLVQRMILAASEAERRAALEQLLPLQRSDFFGLFQAMDGLPVTIRFLDPPLHEFLPKREELVVEIALAKERGQAGPELAEKEQVLRRVRELSEFNPMLGHRGCRLGITYPEISEMQARAIFQAACRFQKEGGHPHPEIMIPLVSLLAEFSEQKKLVERVGREVFEAERVSVPYHVGTMIEVPRAALIAGRIARVADFFSFGTNDLTQSTFGFSRDDSGPFIAEYLNRRLLARDPFVTLDEEGVGALVQMAVEKARKANPRIQLGICGEHGGDPQSVRFFHRVGLDYVSCSPFRVPVARLAAAQAALGESHYTTA